MSWLKWRPEDESLAHKAQKAHWKVWRPEEGMEGEVIHERRPYHIDLVQRSHIDEVILLVKLTDHLYVLIKGHMNRDNPITYTLLYNIPHGQVMNINFDISSSNIQL